MNTRKYKNIHEHPNLQIISIWDVVNVVNASYTATSPFLQVAAAPVAAAPVNETSATVVAFKSRTLWSVWSASPSINTQKARKVQPAEQKWQRWHFWKHQNAANFNCHPKWRGGTMFTPTTRYRTFENSVRKWKPWYTRSGTRYISSYCGQKTFKRVNNIPKQHIIDQWKACGLISGRNLLSWIHKILLIVKDAVHASSSSNHLRRRELRAHHKMSLSPTSRCSNLERNQSVYFLLVRDPTVKSF